jgi:transposase
VTPRCWPKWPAAPCAKISKLQEALTGHFEDHHGFICQLMLERIDQLTIKIDELSRRIDLVIAPFAHRVAQLDEVGASARSPPKSSSPRSAWT